MGFSWAFHWAREAHVEIAKRTIPAAPYVVDRRPSALIGDPANLALYADNANHLSTRREAA